MPWPSAIWHLALSVSLGLSGDWRNLQRLTQRLTLLGGDRSDVGVVIRKLYEAQAWSFSAYSGPAGFIGIAKEARHQQYQLPLPFSFMEASRAASVPYDLAAAAHMDERIKSLTDPLPAGKTL